MKLSRSLSFALACGLLAGAAGAQATWIVDDDGGPGVHFTNIQFAIDAASAGDVIRVFPGSYTGFTLRKALVIVGQPGETVSVHGQARVRDIDAPYKAVLSLLSAYTWELDDCSGAVLLDRCDGWLPDVAHVHGFSSTACTDVRIQLSRFVGLDLFSNGYMDGGAGVMLSLSRLQLSDSWAEGGQGAAGTFCTGHGYHGGPAVGSIMSVIHVYRSSLYGGPGGDDYGIFCGGKGGNGGDAVAGKSVLVAGQPENVLTGGYGGTGTQGSGSPGRSISSLEARHSGVQMTHQVVASTVQVPDPPDPTLSFKTPQPIAGQPLRFMVHGPQDAIVTLLVGREPVLVAPTALKERRLVTLDQDRSPVGVIDSSGVLITKIELPSSAPHGFTFLVQAEILYPDGETRYTNSLTVVLP